MRQSLATLALLCALAGCTRDHDNTATQAPAASDPTAAATAPASDEPQQPVEHPKTTPEPTSGPTPAPGAIGFGGFGPAQWGANEEAVRMAWGKDMQADRVDDPNACHYLFPLPRPHAGFGTAFMFEGGKLVRIDVDSPHVVAPGGGKAGMNAEQIRDLYPGVEARPHKYVETGQYLRVTDPNGGAGVLVFNMTDGTADSWRVGVAPQVDYVEGCS
jgi:hypothetical protein